MSSIRHGLGLALVLGFVACSGGGGVSDAGTDAPACNATGTGSLVVTVTGLPASVAGKVTVQGPSGSPQSVTATQTLSGLQSGNYTVTAARVIGPDPLVRTVYEGTVSTSVVCVGGSANATVTITYAAIPTSNKLWAMNGSGGNGSMLGFASASLAMTGSPAATIAASGPAGASIAFDKDGNFWTQDATAPGTLVHYPASAFASAGAKTPDRTIVIKDLACSPSVSGIALDGSGDLFVSSECDHSVMRLPVAQIAASGTATPSVKLTLDAPRSLAFDSSGNLWVGDGAIKRFDKASLSSSTAMAAAKITVNTPSMSPTALVADQIAFDNANNLWLTDFGGNTFNKMPASALTSTGTSTVTASVQVTITVGALIDGIAFDEGGGLWSTFSQGKVARLSPMQLGVTTTAGSPTNPDVVVSSADIGYGSGLAFYPAPSASPLAAAHP